MLLTTLFNVVRTRIDKFGVVQPNIQKLESGIKTGGISVPTRYVHSPSEMASVSDIENSVKLLYNIAIAQW